MDALISFDFVEFLVIIRIRCSRTSLVLFNFHGAFADRYCCSFYLKLSVLLSLNSYLLKQKYVNR